MDFSKVKTSIAAHMSGVVSGLRVPKRLKTTMPRSESPKRLTSQECIDKAVKYLEQAEFEETVKCRINLDLAEQWMFLAQLLMFTGEDLGGHRPSPT